MTTLTSPDGRMTVTYIKSLFNDQYRIISEDELVERVAKSLFDEEYGLTAKWIDQPESVHEQYCDLAKAAIAAI